LSGTLANWVMALAAFFAFMGRTIVDRHVPVLLAVSLFVAAMPRPSEAEMMDPAAYNDETFGGYVASGAEQREFAAWPNLLHAGQSTPELAGTLLDDAADRRPDVAWYFVYTRDAHPGDHIAHHTSLDVKLTNPRLLRDEVGIRRSILIDDLAGTAHRTFGAMPNMTWVIGRGGRIL
jgi:hypothetical protein